MKKIKFITCICALLALSFAFSGCEIDNYDGPDAGIEGTIFDHLGNPFEASHGAGLIRSREISWTGGEDGYIGNRTLYVQQDGTFRNTRMFSGTYRLLPMGGAFFPFDPVHLETNNAGVELEIRRGQTPRIDFTVTPFLTIEWVRTPWIDAEGHLNASVRFTRNQKGDFIMPNLRDGRMQVSRTINANAALSRYFPTTMTITNEQEGDEIEFRTLIPLRYSGINYWVRIVIYCNNPPGAVYTNVTSGNRTSVETVFFPQR
jgi:hypothetical protein